jgi:hydroxymethylbilane synthase
MERIRLIARNSRLSLLQVARVKNNIQACYPGIVVEVISRSSRGDELAEVPLHTVEGSDFFTKDIFEALENREADIAIHSLKDMSAQHFFGSNHFAVVEREDVRDVAIFRNSVMTKIQNGEEIMMGTCSPRREEMAKGFLKKALPQGKLPIQVTTMPIRGNVDTRLRKLDSGEYDGIILATAGLNRLLSSETDAIIISRLLEGKLLMILPLVECVPAPCQGAIVAEAHPGNREAVEIIDTINKKSLKEDCIKEKKEGMRFGAGCLQRFGVTTIAYDGKKSVFAAGRNSEGKTFTEWTDLPVLKNERRTIFSSTEWMGKFFEYDFRHNDIAIEEPVIYVSNHKAVQQTLAVEWKTKRVWAAGTRTWFELAKKGIWVEGCADALGLESLRTVFSMPLLHINISEVCIITHEDSVPMWKSKGWKAVSTYALSEKENETIKGQLSKADIVFWTSYRQYVLYSKILKKDVIHVCAAGETTEQLRQVSVEPVVFPTLKSFEQWRRSFSRSHSVA